MESFLWTRSRRGCVVSLRSRQCEEEVQVLREHLHCHPGYQRGSNISQPRQCHPRIWTISALDTDHRGQSLDPQRMNHILCLTLRYFTLSFCCRRFNFLYKHFLIIFLFSSKEKLIGSSVTMVRMIIETFANILTSPVMSLLTVWSTTTILCSRKTKT